MIWFVVFDPESGAIRRFGSCLPDDACLQGDVLAFDTDPGVTDATHRVDLITRRLILKGD